MKCLLLVLSLSGLASAIFVNNAATRCPLSVAQAEAACAALGRRSNHFTAHPTECAAFVQCDGVDQATVTAVPEGTMWDNATGAAVHLQASRCPYSPCITGRPISDCSTCFGYLRCLNNQVVSERCQPGQSFSRTTFSCVPDSTCVSQTPITTIEILSSCLPIPNTNYYRKTASLGGSTYTVDITCSAATVMNTTSCVCVPNFVTTCPTLLGDIPNLDLKGGVTPYSIQAMDSNELSGSFTFTVTGVSLSSNLGLGVIALASNSRAGAPGCETPTFELTLDTTSVTFTAINVDRKQATVRAAVGGANTFSEIRVERRGSTLSLYINGSKRDESNLLESARLASTYCSLDIGNSLGRNSFQGQISRVRLQRECN